WVGAPRGRCVVLALAAVGWVLAANLVRMVGVAYCLSRWGLDLTAGWKHEAFGALLFAVTVALVFDTDQLWLYLTAVPGPRPQRRHPTEGIALARRSPSWSPLGLLAGLGFACLALAQVVWFLPALHEGRASENVR